MLFTSWQFFLIFLPTSFAIYFWLLSRRMVIGAKAWLVIASLYFYAHWDVRYLPLILASILINFALGTGLAQGRMATSRSDRHPRNLKVVLAVGIGANIALLGYYKYAGFFVANINAISGASYPLPQIALPLAISFFTFTQIAYLVDSFHGETAEYDLLNYSLFVLYFPHLIAGPVVHHGDIMPQFASRWSLAIRYPNILRGLLMFSIGAFKKLVIADTFSVWANHGFDGSGVLDFYAAWASSLSYTFQLYFDFSGYCDMAMGASLLFNIRLPINFDSPYKALSIQDFWRRWHITLSKFLRDYLYIPLGGNRVASWRIHLNLLITFVLGGLWHGATWMFVIWGALHGLALIVHRLWQRTGAGRLPAAIAWLLTFVFVDVAWVFFRARDMHDARRVLRGLVDWRSAIGRGAGSMPSADLSWGGTLADALMKFFPVGLVAQLPAFLGVVVAFAIVSMPNSQQLVLNYRIDSRRLAIGVFLLIVALYFSLASTGAVFLYFNF